MNRIHMRTRYQDFEIELDDSDLANAVYLTLPLEREINIWGGEIYFEVPVNQDVPGQRKVMEVGEVAYWPQGSAFCIFFGRTPVSKGKAPEAYSPVVPIGKVVSNVDKLEDLADKTLVKLDWQ